MEFLYEIVCVNNDGEEWIDSYWLDEEQARDEFYNVVSIAEDNLPDEDEEEDEDKEAYIILKIQLFKRFLNKSGNAVPYWRDGEKCIFTALVNKSNTAYNIDEGL